MEGLPEGVTAQGLKIPAGQSRGIMLVTAKEDAPRSRRSVTLTGCARIDGATVTRPGRLASMAWPVRDAWQEIPSPRLLADVPVSVSGEAAPLTIAPAKAEVFEAAAGEKLTIPLMQTRRSEFSGATMQLKTFGAGFERVPQFDVPLSADVSQAVLDLASLKTPPGDYLISFYGSAVAKYRYHPEAVIAAEAAHRQAELELKAIEAEAQAAAANTTGELEAKRKAATAAVTVAAAKLKQVTEAAQPKDIVDIVVSEPIAIRVKPAEKK
jgi:hypothetical protein